MADIFQYCAPLLSLSLMCLCLRLSLLRGCSWHCLSNCWHLECAWWQWQDRAGLHLSSPLPSPCSQAILQCRGRRGNLHKLTIKNKNQSAFLKSGTLKDYKRASVIICFFDSAHPAYLFRNKMDHGKDNSSVLDASGEFWRVLIISLYTINKWKPPSGWTICIHLYVAQIWVVVDQWEAAIWTIDQSQASESQSQDIIPSTHSKFLAEEK